MPICAWKTHELDFIQVQSVTGCLFSAKKLAHNKNSQSATTNENRSISFCDANINKTSIESLLDNCLSLGFFLVPQCCSKSTIVAPEHVLSIVYQLLNVIYNPGTK